MNPFNTKFVLQEKRYSWIDYDKGISIILVAYGHCLTILTNAGIHFSSTSFFMYVAMFLYGFRMPLFFIISGVFLSGSLERKGVAGYIYGRMNNILYPLMIWGFLEVSLQLITIYHKYHVINLSLYTDLLTHPRRIGTGHLWYLNALFSIGVIYVLLKSKLRIKPVLQIILGSVLYAVSAYIHKNNLEAGMLTDICEFYVFFALGDTMSKIVLNEKNVDRFASLKIFFPLLIIFLFIQYNLTRINLTAGGGNVDFVEHQHPFLFLIEALVGCILSVNVSFQLQKHKLVRFLRVIGYNSLFIYCMQIIFMFLTTVLLIKALKCTNVSLLVIVVLLSGIFPPIIFYNLCLRFNLWWLFTFKKPAREIEFLNQSKRKTNLQNSQ